MNGISLGLNLDGLRTSAPPPSPSAGTPIGLLLTLTRAAPRLGFVAFPPPGPDTPPAVERPPAPTPEDHP